MKRKFKLNVLRIEVSHSSNVIPHVYVYMLTLTLASADGYL